MPIYPPVLSYSYLRYVDLDGNGRVTQKEIERALHMWNIPIDPEQIAELMASCDQDEDGGVDYDEFVDALARDTVAPDAMGKRGMLSKDAMGVDAYEMLNEQLGHKKIKNHAMPDWMKAGGGSDASKVSGYGFCERLPLRERRMLPTELSMCRGPLPFLTFS